METMLFPLQEEQSRGNVEAISLHHQSHEIDIQWKRVTGTRDRAQDREN